MNLVSLPSFGWRGAAGSSSARNPLLTLVEGRPARSTRQPTSWEASACWWWRSWRLRL